MEKTIIVGGREIKMKASALVPRLYRFKFGRDLISDLSQLSEAYKKRMDLPENATEEEIQDAQLSVLDLTIFEMCIRDRHRSSYEHPIDEKSEKKIPDILSEKFGRAIKVDTF